MTAVAATASTNALVFTRGFSLSTLSMPSTRRMCRQTRQVRARDPLAYCAPALSVFGFHLLVLRRTWRRRQGG